MVPDASRPSKSEDASHLRKFALAALFGLIFGFLLQKGGVAKYHILIGVLLLDDFTVIKVMLSAIIVGMVGFFTLRAMGKVELQTKPLILGATVIGGLLFGAGFALSGYCPGTAAAAVGQGNGDALFSMAGLVAGSYLYAQSSGWLERTLKTWGKRGEPILPELVAMRHAPFVVVFATLLIAGLVILELLTVR